MENRERAALGRRCKTLLDAYRARALERRFRCVRLLRYTAASAVEDRVLIAHTPRDQADDDLNGGPQSPSGGDTPPERPSRVLRVEDAEQSLKDALVTVGVGNDVVGLRFEELPDVGMRIGSLPCLPASLDVEKCKLGIWALQSLADSMAPGLLSLDLEACGLGPSEIAPLAGMLSKNYELRTLLLGRNKLGPEGATLLANQLHCTRLENLGLSSPVQARIGSQRRCLQLTFECYRHLITDDWKVLLAVIMILVWWAMQSSDSLTVSIKSSMKS